MATLILIAVAGVLAGAVNTAAGGGTLLAYPALLVAGLSPAAANMTSLIGLSSGYMSGAWAYRAELNDQRHRFIQLAPSAIAGGVLGGVLLRTTPSGVFERIVPFLVLLSTLLLYAQPRLTRWMQNSRASDWSPVLVQVACFAAGAYGVYFSAGLGVLLLALLGVTLAGDLQLLNGIKTGLSLLIIVAGVIVYAVSPEIDWVMVAVLFPASAVGGLLGGRLARRLSPTALRAVICALGAILTALLFLTSLTTS